MQRRAVVCLAALLVTQPQAALPVAGCFPPALAGPEANTQAPPAASPAPPSAASNPGNALTLTLLDSGVAELYNLRFERAHIEFERWMRENPADPLGPACRLTVCLFQELQRQGIPPGKLLPDTRAPAPRSAQAPDPRLKTTFYEQLQKATDQAQRVLSRQPDDQAALLALTIVFATHADYLNLVEKRSWASLTLFKKSNRYAQQLLKRNPNAQDAWAASGLSEYLASSLPFYARWFVRFDGVKGDKEAAVAQLRRAATGGRYLRPYAKVLLAEVYLREKRFQEGLRVLRELNSEFPDNATVAAEITQVLGHIDKAPSSPK